MSLLDMLWTESRKVLASMISKTIAKIDHPTEDQIRWTFTDGSAVVMQWSEGEAWSAHTTESPDIQFHEDKPA